MSNLQDMGPSLQSSITLLEISKRWFNREVIIACKDSTHLACLKKARRRKRSRMTIQKILKKLLWT
tara:strand:+ start:78 stop:275 length:198 start_codon:yes stop_codon:yes gene_type:complete